MTQTLDSKELLKLIANCELESFAKSLGVSLTTSSPRKEIEDKLESFSRTKVMSAVLQVNGTWLNMMRDVVRFLESCNVSLRTTGVVLILPGPDERAEFYLSPQVANVLATFDASTMHPKASSDWDHALRAFRGLENWVEGVQQSAEPRRTRRLSHNRMLRAARGEGPIDFYEKVIRVDSIASEQMFSLWRTLEYLNHKLSEIVKSAGVPAEVTELITLLSNCSSRLTHRIGHMRRDRKMWSQITRSVKNTDPWSESLTADELFRGDCWRGEKYWDDWVRFVEDVLILARFETSSEVADLLRLDLLKDRPRLFELWCLAKILSWYRSCRCTVDLESIEQSNPPVWNLNYSRSENPIARIQNEANRWWVFYQLFRQGVHRANMPDLALLDGCDPKSNAIWIADPKYSEAGAYTRADYVEVAERYRDTFHPQHVWICEFFSRPNWFGGACVWHGLEFSILTEVQPQGEGMRILEHALGDLHGLEASEFLLAIDCSGSFADKLPELERTIQCLAGRAVATVCFADSTIVIRNSDLIDLAVFQDQRSLLGGGTLLGPLVLELEHLPERDSSRTDLVLITDGQFSDHVDSLRAKLGGMFARVQQAGDKDSLVEIMAKYCPT